MFEFPHSLEEMFRLRYYQHRLINGAECKWQEYQSTAIISATGTGKTEMYMYMAIKEPGRVLVLVHRDYLIRQPIKRLAAAGFQDVAVEKANLRSEAGSGKRAKIVFASVQSIGSQSQADRLRSFDPKEFSLVIVDEGHRALAPTYRTVLDYFAANRSTKILILTATPKRKDGLALLNICESEAGVYGPTTAMAEGWIVPTKFYRREVKTLDFSGVKLRGSDLDPEQVQERLMQEEPLHEVCASLVQDTGPTLVFCPQVLVAKAYEALINKRYRPGRAKVLSEENSDEERDTVGKMLADGEIDYIFNVDLYTEGYDLPNLLRVVWAAPTASLVRYTQGVGRVFRPHSSIAKHLQGGLDESESRRLLIAQSPKPFGIVVTYYPQNCQHELCDPVDILGGESLSAQTKHYAKQLQNETSRQKGGSRTEEDIETATIFVDLLAAADERLREIKAKAEYVDHAFDPMSGRAQKSRKKESVTVADSETIAQTWGSTELATEPQKKWLIWKGVSPEIAATCTKWRAMVVRDLVDSGISLQTAINYPRKQALAVRDKLRATKGKTSDAH